MKMKKTLTLGTLLLGCCLAAAAQAPGAQSQTPPAATPTDQGAIPSSQNTPDQAAQPGSSQVTTIQGCLSKSSDGNFVLAENSGDSFRLQGDTAKLESYIGKQVKLEGMVITSDTTAGAMSSNTSPDSGSPAGAAKQFNVNNVHKVANTCAS